MKRELEKERQQLIDSLLKRQVYDTDSKVRTLINEQFRKEANYFGHVDDLAWDFCLKGNAAKKRRNAVFNNMERARRDFGKLSLQSLEETFARFEAESIDTYNNVDVRGNIVLGAAIWILDEVTRSRKLSEIYKYLPTEYKDITMPDIPFDFYHPCYDMDLVRSVQYMIITRNGALMLTDEGKRNEEYDHILELIDAKKIERACSTFEEKQWDILNRAMKFNAYIDEQDRRIRQELRQRMMAASSSPVLSKSYTDGEIAPLELMDKWDELNDKRISIEQEFADHLYMTRRELVKSTGSRYAAEAFLGFEIDDPYEICFALIYLLDSGSDAPWLMKSGTTLMLYAVRMLPWYRYYADMEKEEIDEDDLFPGALRRDHNNWLENDPKENMTDIYHTRYNGRNIAQIIFDMCRGVMPRDMHPFMKERCELIADGMDEAVVDQIIHISELIFHGAFQSKADNLGSDRAWWDEIEGWTNDNNDNSEESDEAEAALEKSENDRSEEIVKLKRQIKDLRKALNELSHDMQSAESKYETELKTLRQEHRELADLRAIVFSREQGEQDQKTDPGIQFPYEIQKRTVIFGGHEGFLKTFKKLIPDAKYIDVGNYTFSPEIIRNADVVWVQNNCISHSQYYRILNITRQYGIQLRYFSYSSAEKSAAQLAAEDQKA